MRLPRTTTGTSINYAISTNRQSGGVTQAAKGTHKQQQLLLKRILLFCYYCSCCLSTILITCLSAKLQVSEAFTVKTFPSILSFVPRENNSVSASIHSIRPFDGRNTIWQSTAATTTRRTSTAGSTTGGIMLDSSNSNFAIRKQRHILFSSSSTASVSDDHQRDTLELLQQCKDYTIQDSFNLVVLGDLHLEDDMSKHYEAREDCLSALKELSLLPSPPLLSSSCVHGENGENNNNVNNNISSSSSMATTTLPSLRIRDIITPLKQIPAGELTLAQLEILLQEKKQGDFINCHVVSLGDLGRKDIRHEPGDAGTTKSFQDAKEYLDGFHLPYDLVTGNHDLEGLDEFHTDRENLEAWMKCFDKTVPYFSKYIGSRTLLVGLSTVRFRDAPYSSHECHVDEEQLEWFEKTVRDHSSEEGWRIFVFTHAPIMGSNLRVLQNVHVINGCAWMNHCSPSRSRFIEIVRECPQIKLWCSGHFHLSHEFPDSLSRVNQCTFVQVGVVGQRSTRDHTRQTRIIQGNDREICIYTVNHHVRTNNASRGNSGDGNGSNTETEMLLRLDAKVDLYSGEMWRHIPDRSSSNSSDEEEEDKSNGSSREADPWFSAYIPQPEDGCYLESPSGKIASGKDMDEKVCWWHMHDGKVLGVHEGQIVEYDATTLSPLGIVVSRKELKDREVLIVGDDSKVIVLVDPETDQLEIVHPNDDGSYWRKYQRNKRIRQEEKAREMAAKLWLERKRHVVPQE